MALQGGFKFVRTTDGSVLPACETVYSDDSSVIGIGDPVTATTGVLTDGKYVTVAKGVSTNSFYGVVVGVDQIRGLNASTSFGRRHKPASTGMYISIIRLAPNQIWEIAEDAVGGALAYTNIRGNSNQYGNVTTGSSVDAVSGDSGMLLDSSTVDSTNTKDLKIVRVAQEADNKLGTQAVFEVKFVNIDA